MIGWFGESGGLVTVRAASLRVRTVLVLCVMYLPQLWVGRQCLGPVLARQVEEGEESQGSEGVQGAGSDSSQSSTVSPIARVSTQRGSMIFFS